MILFLNVTFPFLLSPKQKKKEPQSNAKQCENQAFENRIIDRIPLYILNFYRIDDSYFESQSDLGKRQK